MALVISESTFNKVANFFGAENVRVARGGRSIIIQPINNVMTDMRSNTVQYALYQYEDGFRWRRFVDSTWAHFLDVKPYQLFRHGINYRQCSWGSYPTDYVFESFATVEEAIARFMKYVNRYNMAA